MLEFSVCTVVTASSFYKPECEKRLQTSPDPQTKSEYILIMCIFSGVDQMGITTSRAEAPGDDTGGMLPGRKQGSDAQVMKSLGMKWTSSWTWKMKWGFIFTNKA